MEWVANLLSKEQESVNKFELVRPEDPRIVKNQFFIFWAEWRRCHPITDLGDLRVGFGGRIWPYGVGYIGHMVVSIALAILELHRAKQLVITRFY